MFPYEEIIFYDIFYTLLGKKNWAIQIQSTAKIIKTYQIVASHANIKILFSAYKSLETKFVHVVAYCM